MINDKKIDINHYILKYKYLLDYDYEYVLLYE